MIRYLFLAIFLIPFSLKAQLTAPSLKISWEIIENNHQGKSASLTAFTITNTDKKALPKSGWVMYFNFVRKVDTTLSADLKIRHINGDLFQLLPTANFQGLKPGASVQVNAVSEAWVVNFTDAPAGLYWVWDQQPEKAYSLTDYTITPSTQPRQYQRFAGDKMGLITPAMIFAQNKSIQDIPEKELPKILPSPQQYRETGVSFMVTPETKVFATGELKEEASFLNAQLSSMIGKPLASSTRKTDGAIVFRVDSSLSKEGYRLTVNEKGIEIAAADRPGAFYGVQSLLALLPPSSWGKTQTSLSVPGVEVSDLPRFGHRAIMLDIARNFHSKKQLLKLLDLMAFYKLNVLHLHFSDDEGWRLEIPSLPELTQVGAVRGHSNVPLKNLAPAYGSGPDINGAAGTGYYSRLEFVDILRYANARHIKVIPEIEAPGHARAAIKAMEARYNAKLTEGLKAEAEKYLLHDPTDRSVYRSVQMYNDNVINVAMPSVYRFLEKVTDDILGMYREAGAPIETIHYGGDEVPAGVWTNSPAVEKLRQQNPELKTSDDLWYYFYGKINDMVQKRGLFLYGWEEIGMRKTLLDGKSHVIPNPDFVGQDMQVDVWNNVLGWGAEDLAYRLANAGYKVVLSCVTHMYFDMSYYKSFDEPGYYWGAYIDVDKPFSFIPYDYFKNSKEDRLGNPLDRSIFNGKERLTDYGKQNIVGIQGLLWSETVNSPERMEYMMLPKLMGMAERAWAQSPAWAETNDEKAYQKAWSVFANQLGKRELPRLDSFAGGFAYRLPTAGAIVEGNQVQTNVQLPGLIVRYTTDGSEPTANSAVYSQPLPVSKLIKFKVFNGNGRSGRTVEVNP
ncbi:family 20 glycosylhydrolase [Runella sp.]|uniref:family 20 glycosylhydrolase n=1 Tax=Runella sp. TaxID=1960881 RepID=UPI003D0A85EB